MTPIKFKEFVEQFVETEYKMTSWLDTVPEQIRSAFFDNDYTDSQGYFITYLVETFLGDNLAEEVFWFLYDWKPGADIYVTKEGGGSITYTINNIDDFVAYCATEYDFD